MTIPATQYFDIQFFKKTKSVHIYFKKGSQGLNLEILFELENIFSWLTPHSEISSIVFSSADDQFCCGIDPNHLVKMDNLQLSRFQKKLQKVLYSLLHLPQLLIVDLKHSTSNLGIDLSLCADLRIAHKDSVMNFDYLSKALMPTTLGINLLQSLIGNALCQNWIYSEKSVALKSDNNSLVVDFYEQDREFFISCFCSKISKQSNVTRIQTKRSFLQSNLNTWNEHNELNNKLARACEFSGDWKKAATNQIMNTDEKFIEPREFSKIVKLVDTKKYQVT